MSGWKSGVASDYSESFSGLVMAHHGDPLEVRLASRVDSFQSTEDKTLLESNFHESKLQKSLVKLKPESS